VIEQIDTINNQTILGTGWFCGDGKTVVTNAHVLKGKYNVLKVYNVASGKEYTIDHINYLNPKDEVAALTVREENDSFLSISDTAPVEGSNVTVIGNPKEHYGTVTTGIVSALRTNPKAGSIMQISALVSHGSSGSPVLNDNGEVIGMVWGGAPQADAHDLNYAVPQDILKSDLFGISTFNIGGPLAFATLPSPQPFTSPTATPTPTVQTKAPPTVHANAAYAYCLRGYECQEQGDFYNAISNFNKAIWLKPNYTAAYIGRGSAYLHFGNSAQADADFATGHRLEAGQ
jgi:serine protease Do